MTFRHLQIFIQVADCGSMTGASEVLFISQPTVSQAISELEDYYKTKLFDRLARRLYITESGKQLLGYARHIIKLVEEMDQMMKNPDTTGRLKIGASLTIGSYMMPQLVKEFKKIYPFIMVQAVVKNTKDIEGQIIKNTIDFAVVEGIVHNSDIISTAFMDDEVVLVCGKSHPLYQSNGITADELEKLEFIVREPGSGTRELFETTMASKDINWNLIWESNGSDGLKSAAESGIGVAVISKKLVESELQEGKLSLLKISNIEFKRKFSIIHHKNKYLTDSMKAFFELCHNISK